MEDRGICRKYNHPDENTSTSFPGYVAITRLNVKSYNATDKVCWSNGYTKMFTPGC